MSSRVRYEIVTRTLADLIDELNENPSDITIPEHQREFCWSLAKQQRFIDTLIQGTPTQGIIMRREGRGKSTVLFLEDGRQRLTTTQRFMNNEFTVPFKGQYVKFEELPEEERKAIERYQISVTTYWNATPDQTIEIFDRFQNGEPLTIGERYYSMKAICPIVKYTFDTLMTNESPLSQRVKEVFGDRTGADKGRKNLTNAMAMIFGLSFGSERITKKWSEISENKTTFLTNNKFDAKKTTENLKKLLEIYEAADEVYPVSGKANLNKQWSVGTVTGYIIHSLMREDAPPFKELKKGWVKFLVEARKSPKKIDTVLHADEKSARSWNYERWNLGYLRVFDPEEAERLAEEREEEKALKKANKKAKGGVASGGGATPEESEEEDSDDSEE